MRIALLTDGIYPYVLGGMQKHSYFMAKYLAASGVKVDLFHCLPEGTKIPENSGADPKYFDENELQNLSFWSTYFPREKSGLPGHYLRENKTYSKRLFDEVNKRAGSYDLIYAQGYTGWECIRQRKNGKLDVPVIVNFHGLEMFQKPPSFKVKLQHMSLKSVTKWNIQNSDYVVTFGGKITEILERLEVPQSKLVELPIGIERSWLNQEPGQRSDKARKFVFIGRYERRKGIEELNIALQELLKEENLDFKFHFVGPIPQTKRIKNQQIIYHNEVRDEKVIKEILKDSDVLVCPSHSEGMPTVILEGMARGLAIIATDVGATAKQVKGNGWLLTEARVEVIKKALFDACVIPPTQLIVFQKKSLELIKEEFLWEKVAAQSIQKFEEIIKEDPKIG